jgi:FkbM family methyltransferase
MQMNPNGIVIFAIRLLRRHFRYSRLIDSFLYERVFRFFLHLFLPRRGEIVFRGRRLFINASDISLFPSLITGEFERKELDWLISRYSKRAGRCLLIDIGANIGVYSCFFLACSPLFKAICFEPDPRNRKYLEANLTNNIPDVDQWNIVSAAVSNKCGKSFFRQMPDNGQSHLINTITAEAKALEVETISLQQILSEIDSSHYQEILIKMDVEGAEVDILTEPGKALSESNITLIIEFNPSLTDRQTFLKVLRPFLDKYREVGIFTDDELLRIPSNDFPQSLPLVLSNILLESKSNMV